MITRKSPPVAEEAQTVTQEPPAAAGKAMGKTGKIPQAQGQRVDSIWRERVFAAGFRDQTLTMARTTLARHDRVLP
jgi:hypothetical protein